jgi:acetone carboxylase gamma subunit
LGALDGNPKEAMVLMQRPIAKAAMQLPDPKQFVDAEVVFREFCCPGCGVRLATEVAEPDTPILAEIRLARSASDAGR